MRKGMPQFLTIVSVSLLFVLHAPILYCADVVITGTQEPKQGEIFPVKVLSDEELVKVKVQYGKESVYLRCEGKRAEGWFGFDLNSSTGDKELTLFLVKKTGTRKVTNNVKVIPAAFPTQHIQGVEDSYVNPGKKEMKRINTESALLKIIWQNSDSLIHWEGNFIPPFDGFNGNGFGRKRMINSEQRNPHTGVDAVAPRGTSVRAINHGAVKMSQELFFSGISVVIDHGGGLFSMYFHLEDSTVKAGDYVEKGTLIGRVGSSGRATGPHLHLGVRIVNERVNPMDLFR
jgi:murein DD-endopeptidase MepM/ murein hydrolase activator NlpD